MRSRTSQKRGTELDMKFYRYAPRLIILGDFNGNRQNARKEAGGSRAHRPPDLHRHAVDRNAGGSHELSSHAQPGRSCRGDAVAHHFSGAIADNEIIPEERRVPVLAPARMPSARRAVARTRSWSPCARRA